MIADGLDGIEAVPQQVCVVGSGPVGLALATRLAAQGVPVLLLESGGVAADPQVQALAQAERVDEDVHDDLMIATARRLGGTSNLWGARCLPYDPIDFAERPWVGASWPIAYDVIARYLGDAVAATASGAPVYREAASGPLAGAGPDFDATPLERWANVQQAQRIHADAIARDALLHLRTHVTVTGLEFADGRVAALAICDTRSGEQRRLPVNEVVLAGGGLETVRLLLAAQLDAPGRFGGAEGPLGRYYMGHVTGEIADIRFEDPALASAFDFRVDAHGSYVRRRIVPADALQIEHRLLNCAFWPVVPQIGHAAHGSAILSMIWLVMRMKPVARLLIAEKLRLANLTPEDSPIPRHLLNVMSGLPATAAFGVDFLRKRYDRTTRLPGLFIRNPAGRYGLQYHSEQWPNPDSRVTLSGSRDRLGVPCLRIDLRFSERDADSIVRTHDLLEAWLAEAGFASLHYRVPAAERAAAVLGQARHGAHQIGIARMAAGPREGIVDAQLRSFEAPNLSIASTAVLPTSGQANPTLTAVALALRLADRLAAPHSSGPIPVAASSPVAA
ncbi:GMC oxidoreductase [Erythrobacter sp. NE805]|uniref:GMC oxidoreductase n=1 Tax=Erythrobacter sp. NE805 TaxID=3389875 RepID=UPI00396B21D6